MDSHPTPPPSRRPRFDGSGLRYHITCALLILPLWLVLYLVLFYTNCRFAEAQVSVLLGHQWSDPVFSAVLTAIITGYLSADALAQINRHWEIPWLDRNTISHGCRKAHTPLFRRVFHLLSWVIVTYTVVFLFESAFAGLALNESGFYDRHNVGDIPGSYYPYTSVAEVRIPARDSKDPQYEIVLNNGTVLYTAETFGIPAQQFKDAALPLFQAAGVSITESEE